MAEDWIWTRYWHFDRVASCMDGAGLRNYVEEVAAGWRTFFRRLPPNSTILDLCTGNGAIALLAAEVGRVTEKDFVVIGVDGAAIDPKRHVQKYREDLERIEFRASVDVEKLPLANCSVSAIVSQYGIEYSDLSKSLAEVGRVLSRSGCLRFVLHAADGAVAEAANKSVEEANYLLERVDLPGAAARCLEAVLSIERDPAVQPDARRIADESYNRFQAALTATAQYLHSATEQKMVQTSISVLADTFAKRAYFDLPKLLDKVEEVRTEIVGHKGRSMALIMAAVTDEDLSVISDMLRAAAIPEVVCSRLTRHGRLIGYVIEGSRDI